MEMKKIEKNIDITASQQNVWRVLTEDEFSRQWFAEFMPGTYAESDWQVGSKVEYKDGSGSGMYGTVIVYDAPNKLSVQMAGEIIDGERKPVFENSGEPMLETYTLTQNHGLTHLHIETGMSADYYETMDQSWDRAVEKVRMLSEMLEVQN